LFTALYLAFPNTKVQWRAALVGGFVAGALVQMNNLSNVLYASRVARDKNIYGGLAAIPLFLLGLYLSWTIILLGAQVAYAFQNRRAYVHEKQTQNVSQRGCEFVALRLITCIGQQFHSASKAPSALELAESFGLSLRFVSQVLGRLQQADLVREVGDPQSGFVPARPLDQISAHDILEALRRGGGAEPVTSPDEARVVIQDEFAQIEQAEREVAGSITLQSLVERTKPAAKA
jgi:membrane protein